LLPTEAWGRDEDYLWYSTGAAACFTDLAEGYLGEGTLQARYIRGAFDDKPFTLGKYESTRIRVAIAELAANGGAPMGFYTRFTDPEARQEIVRYYQFLKRHDDLFRANRSHAEAVLLYPRSQVHHGNVAAVESFKRIGERLLDAHVLFDVLPDDPPPTDGYRRVFRVPDNVSNAVENLALDDLPTEFSRFTAPRTVRISASRPVGGDELTLHFVNYNRQEPEKKRSPGRGIVDERPIAVEGVKADLQLPLGTRCSEVVVLTPESPEPRAVVFEQTAEGRLRFSVPSFLVYSVVRIIFDN
jgi:hypothetical protein